MVSGVASIQEIFNFEFEDKSLNGVIAEFGNRRNVYLSIPKYQREYTWEDNKIKTFVDDIYINSKFLGIIVLEKNRKHNCLDIVDGQQRITTLILVCVCLYNILQKEEETVKANEIMAVLEHQNNLILWNDSVGKFIHKRENELYINVLEEDDIYRQGAKFKEAYDVIYKKIKSYKSDISKREWKTKLIQMVMHVFDCQMVLFVNVISKNEGSIEEIYIDINEKAQRLDEESIFKGYCFSKIKDSSMQENLKCQWIDIKQDFYKIKDLHFKDLSSLLHKYLLIKERTTRISEHLHINGKHYLEDKHPSEIVHLLKEFNLFEKNLYIYKTNIDSKTYRFSDLAKVKRTIDDDLDFLKKISNYILFAKQNIYKLAFLHYIDVNLTMTTKVSQVDLQSFFRLYYVYFFICVDIFQIRTRSYLPIKVIEAIDENESILESLYEEIRMILEQKSDSVRFVINKGNFKLLYSILDTVESKRSNNKLIEIKLKSYSTKTIEHLIINDSLKLNWKRKQGDEYKFSEELYLEYKEFKDLENNLILVSNKDNEAMGTFDIITKIGYIEKNNLDKSKHISIYLNYIKSLNSYKLLVEAKNEDLSKIEVLKRYKDFLSDYFSTEKINTLSSNLYSVFRRKIWEL